MNPRFVNWSLLAAAVVLSALVGILALELQPPALDHNPADQELAKVTARLLMRELNSTVRTFELGAELFDLPSLPAEERTGVLRMLYKQDPDLSVVVFLDSTDQAAVQPVYLRQEQIEGEGSRSRLPVDETDLGLFLKHLPIQAAREGGKSLSGVYADPRRNAVLIAGAMLVPAGEGEKPWLLGFERTLRTLRQSVTAIGNQGAHTVFVVDGGGRLVVHPDGNRVLQRESMAEHPLVARVLGGQRSGRGCWFGSLDPSGAERELCGAFQKLDVVDWAVAVQRTAPTRAAGGLPLWAVVAWLLIACGTLAGGWWTGRHLQADPSEMESLKASLAETAQLREDYEQRAEQLKRVQASLLETRKLNAIGDLGAGVAHEFNNPIGGILGLTQLLLRKKSADDPDMQFLKRIEEEAKRCKVITDNLLRFSEQQGVDHREPLRVERVVEKALDLIDSRLDRERIKIERNFGEVPRVMANEGELQRAVLNVLLNAETAMPEGGRLTLSTMSEDGKVLVRIEDTGRGIPAENLERVLEPFFTTKDNWKGAGLGLWVVFQILQDHGGGVAVDSSEKGGTVVTLHLPPESSEGAKAVSRVPLA